MNRFALLVVLAGCGDAAEGRRGASADANADTRADAETRVDEVADERPHPGAWVGLWLVDQPAHALYEATYYTFELDGRLVVGPSDPPDCGAHLEKHCVTGSVGVDGQEEPSCVFGDAWWASDVEHVGFTGVCSDGTAREIILAIDGFTLGVEGFEPTVESVGGETGWVHDNWSWRFQRCRPGVDPSMPTYCCGDPQACAQ